MRSNRLTSSFFFFLVTRRFTNYAIVEKHGDEEEKEEKEEGEEKEEKTRGGADRSKKTSSISRPLYRDSICFFERRKSRRCPPRACQINTRR